ncbi:MAG: hypothetical protein RL291_23 [Pseudomonadota bacterium]
MRNSDNREPNETPPSRRTILTAAAAGFVGVGAAAALWPFVHQMNPNPGSPPDPSVTIDLSGIAVGTTKIVPIDTLPIFIRHRTQAMIAETARVDVSTLHDRNARNPAYPDGRPALDAFRHLPNAPQWLVVVGACTRDRCVIRPFDGTTVPEAWFCPCCASRYDHAGRVLKGPAPRNLDIPPTDRPSTATLRIYPCRLPLCGSAQ